MKVRMIALLIALLSAFAFSLLLNCGDDDDDDSGGSGGWTCSEGCSIIYDDCNLYIDYPYDEPASESECVQYCESEGGIDSCLAGCLNNYQDDEECTVLVDCVYNCM